MDKNGYILWYRKFMDNPFLNQKPFCKGYAWLVLVALTNRKVGYIPNKNGSKIKIFRGECGYSKKALADIFGWSRGKVDRYLKELEDRKMIQQKNVSNHTVIKVLKYNIFQNGHQTDIQIEQQKNNKIEQQKNSENADKIYISKSELEKMIQQKIKETDRETDTNKEYIDNSNIYNISLSNKEKISEKEREILNNYVKRNKLAKSSVRAYVNALIKNGDHIDILKEEKLRIEKLEAQQKLQAESCPPEKEEKPSPEDTKRGLELLRNTAAEIKRRRTT